MAPIALRGFVVSVIMAALMLIASIGTAYAADLTVGATVWYAWWQFATKEFNDTVSNDRKDSGFMYGPTVSLKFDENWSLGTRFITGAFGTNETTGYDYDVGSDFISHDMTYKFDSDTTVTYSVTKWFRLFGGFKWMGYQWYSKHRYTNVEGYAEFRSYRSYENTYGPGLGFGFSFPLADRFYLIINVNGLYAVGTEQLFVTELYYDPAMSQYSGLTIQTLDLVSWGGNSDIAFAYYIPSAKTTLSLGFRYQQLKVIGRDRKEYLNHEDPNMERDTQDIFYGVTFTALYYFDI